MYFKVPELEVDAGADDIEPCASWEECINENETGEGGPGEERPFEPIRVPEHKALYMEFVNRVLEVDRKKFAREEGFGIVVAKATEVFERVVAKAKAS
jgi:hypothetical protein